MNKTILLGRLTADPEVRESKGKEPITIINFRLAVNRAYVREGDEVTADFFSCTAFGRKAEFVERFLAQGIKVLVTGRMQNDNYTNRDGDKVYGMNLIVEDIEFAESKKASEDGNREDDYAERDRSRNSRSGRSSARSEGEESRRASYRDSREENRDREKSRRNEYSEREDPGRRSARGDAGRDDDYDDRRGSRSRNGSRRNADNDFMDMDDVDAGMLFD